ncbi:MAG TPA: alkaline phosphatase family protein [Stellaceae bacterium]|nr:alkaline phosphatase family protein [Stellaceae bacterium]
MLSSSAAQALDYHPAPPGAAIAPYVVAPGAQPRLPREALWRLIRRHIRYVFVIYQENRSFDSYFGTFPGADGLYSRPAEKTPGFSQVLLGRNGKLGTIRPFRIGPKQFAADTDDIDHSHSRILAKMNIVGGRPQMNHFALVEERKYSPFGNPSLAAKQFGELAMAYEDCDTVPLLWRYADRFVLFDHVFQLITGPSTPGNLAIIAAQSGETQWVLHPNEAFRGDGDQGMGVPVVNDADPYWGSELDNSAQKMPVNPHDIKNGRLYATQRNLTFASLPLTLRGKTLAATSKQDSNPDGDLADVANDIAAVTRAGNPPFAFGWYEEGYDREPTDPGPTDAEGTHASYITHHNGPQYFGYVANNPEMRAQLHGLADFFTAIDKRALPQSGGVFFVKGGYRNTLGLKPADPDPQVQQKFVGDDDHPGYSDAQISEALVAETVNRIAASPYWPNSAIILTWDDSEGDYDHAPPPVRTKGPDGSVVTDGPRVPLLVISPYARAHRVAHEQGDQASVVKFVDRLFGLTPLALLPDEARARRLGLEKFGLADLGPADALAAGVADLSSAVDPARLAGRAKPLPAAYASIPEKLVRNLPAASGLGCKALGITPVDYALGVANMIPADFNPRPKTNPTAAAKR